MARVTVEIPGRPYPVEISRGALNQLPRLVDEIDPSRVVMVTDRTVGRLWAELAAEKLESAGRPCRLLQVEPGEGSKSMAGLEQVLALFEAAGVDRKGLVVAFGGGVVSDLAGFSAAIWRRGIRFLTVTTTLEGMVDASIGGKTAIDTPRSKNAIGAFWQPVAVVADLDLLTTLPRSQLIAGLAEVIKYGLSLDAKLASELLQNASNLKQADPEALEPVVTRCIELKAAMVASDERDEGARAILNYGHTAGHAIEIVSGYAVAHGRAVAQGMRIAARLSRALDLCPSSVVERHDQLLSAYDLPGSLPKLNLEAVLEAVSRDAKAVAGKPRWVLPEAVGVARTGVEVPDRIVRRVIGEVLEA
jgi:3-dehydroquinate synthase